MELGIPPYSNENMKILHFERTVFLFSSRSPKGHNGPRWPETTVVDDGGEIHKFHEEVGSSIPGCEISSLIDRKTCQVVSCLLYFDADLSTFGKKKVTTFHNCFTSSEDLHQSSIHNMDSVKCLIPRNETITLAYPGQYCKYNCICPLQWTHPSSVLSGWTTWMELIGCEFES